MSKNSHRGRRYECHYLEEIEQTKAGSVLHMRVVTPRGKASWMRLTLEPWTVRQLADAHATQLKGKKLEADRNLEEFRDAMQQHTRV